MKPLPSAETIRERLEYDPNTGLLTWKTDRNNVIPAGSVAGHLRKNGYVGVKFSGRWFSAHRLAWLIYYGSWPTLDIDHKNCVPSDNRIANLRQATKRQNIQNQRLCSRNTSGFKGVTWHRKCKKWQAQIKTGGKTIHLGIYSDIVAAKAAYDAACAIYHGEFARSA
ncbi:HNH endonuclease [Mesorhizobium sp. BR1-1-16]|uniref:HNH endonuclease n=1 Tax=Mesorhizobium sp. BR1-1-16 TaxID=2876653 RepID=UPI001CCAB07F|nr:HNH endonuclease [Mesorhizobium sp. BR1-1-16]MBZ9939178.1 HNH endonuclease [Mesorhizobium sp. BR1-1-16]